MHKTSLLLFLLFCLLQPLGAEVLCRRITSSPQIDGLLGDDAWQHAKATEFLSQEQIRTEFRFLHDEHNLYLGITCHEPAIKDMRAKVTRRDLNVYSDDSVEIFLNPAKGSEQYLQLIVNSLGTVYDTRIVGQTRIPGWDLIGLEVKTSVGDQAWNIEMRMPIAALLSVLDTLPLRKAVTADSWSFNLVRNRYSGKQKSWPYAAVSHWLDLGNYQPLQGVAAAYDRMYWGVNGLSLISLQPRENVHPVEIRGSIDNCTAAGKIIKIISSLVPAQDEKGTESFTTSETVFIDRGQVFNFQHSVQLPAPGEYRCSLVLADAQDNMLGLVQTPMLVHYEELSLKVLEPGYRSAIYSTQKCPELILALKSDVLTDVADSVQAEFCIFGDGEQAPLLKKTASFNEFMRQPFTVAIPALPPGTYHCRITAQVSENHTASAQTAFTVHAPAPFETWVNEHGRIVRNGQPVFPIGSYADYWRYLPDSDPVDFIVCYAPAPDLGNDATRRKLEQYEKAGRQYLWYPETKELWSHPEGSGKALAMRPIPPENAAKIKERLRQYRHEGSLFGWYVVDEPSTSKISPLYTQDMYRLIQEADPYHPATMVFNAVGPALLYGGYCDIAFIDFFPGYHVDGRNQPLENLALMLNDTRKGLGPRKPILSAIPMFPYAPNRTPRYPTYLESRCLTFLSLVCGAQGIIWNSSHHIRCDLENYIGIPLITREIRALGEVWLSTEEAALQLSGRDADAVYASAKMLRGEVYITAVNPHDRKISVEIALPADLAAARLHELASTAPPVKRNGGKLSIDFEPLQVRLFSSDPAAPNLVAPETILAEVRKQQEQFESSGNLCYFTRGTRLLFSEHYNKDMRVPAHQQCLIDGMLVKYFHGVPNKYMAGEKYLGVEFPEPENISRVCISWDPINGAVPPDEELLFRLEGGDADGSFRPITIDGKSQRRDNGFLDCTLTFKPAKLKKFRIVFTGKHPILPQPSEIQAFQ